MLPPDVLHALDVLANPSHACPCSLRALRCTCSTRSACCACSPGSHTQAGMQLDKATSEGFLESYSVP